MAFMSFLNLCWVLALYIVYKSVGDICVQSCLSVHVCTNDCPHVKYGTDDGTSFSLQTCSVDYSGKESLSLALRSPYGLKKPYQSSG